MYTQCVRCLTVYRLQAESLARARGQFRCGHCGTVFDGLERDAGGIEHSRDATSATPAGVVQS